MKKQEDIIIEMIDILATYKPDAKPEGKYGWDTKIKKICEVINGEEPSEEYIKKIINKWHKKFF